MNLREMTPDDADRVDPVARAAFDDLLARQGREPRPSPPDVQAYRGAVHRYLLQTGRGWGAFDDEEDLVGVALAHQRAGLWTLSLLVVSPAGQKRGTGSALLQTALADAGDVRLVHCSRNPLAARLYARAGFRLVPTLSAGGTARLHAGPAVVDASTDDPDIAFQLTNGGRLLRLADGRDGVCLVGPPIPARAVQVLAAADPVTAADLLRGVLAEVGGEVDLSYLAPQEAWAHDVCLDAGLELLPGGPLCVAGPVDPLGGVTKLPGVFV